jgi:adenosylhomocysteinase
MKDGAMVCNSGHFDVEVDLPALQAESEGNPTEVRNHVHEYRMKNGRRIYVIGEGRLVNLAAAEGHPPSVMDMSFATQALATEYCIKNKGKLSAAVHEVPKEVEDFVARHKLASMGITIDELTVSQKKYMSGWEQGT